ncbi:MAG: twin-arginine translocase TatA/TatE family subunit [Phycisphaera sp.]|nr:twin-arginine translocase TatA/TatE family subunit [Phycisphaera sp.]
MNLLTSNALLAFGLPGGWEWIVLLVIGLLLFGRRLPEVGRSIGQGIKEFKKGLKDVEDDVKREEPAARKTLPGEQVMQAPEGTQSRAEQR